MTGLREFAEFVAEQEQAKKTYVQIGNKYYALRDNGKIDCDMETFDKLQLEAA